MVAQASLDNLPKDSTESAANGKKGAETTNRLRFNSNVKLAELQHEMFRLAMDKELDAAKKTAAANTFVKLEERRRLNLGHANPAPVKSEPKRSKRSAARLSPAQVQASTEPEPVPPQP